jgi:hypothetical protein
VLSYLLLLWCQFLERRYCGKANLPFHGGPTCLFGMLISHMDARDWLKRTRQDTVVSRGRLGGHVDPAGCWMYKREARKIVCVIHKSR